MNPLKLINNNNSDNCFFVICHYFIIFTNRIDIKLKRNLIFILIYILKIDNNQIILVKNILLI
jgi:hypothetical protein